MSGRKGSLSPTSFQTARMWFNRPMASTRSRVSKKKPRLKHIVCKPCWELKYCPYGPLVEYFPLISEEDPTPLSQIKRSYDSWLSALKTGNLQTETAVFEAIEKVLCLEPRRWKWVSQFRTDELRCSVFGHICPVFLSAEAFTETKEPRRIGRTIPREVMLKVVRRDGQVCSECRVNVPDNQIEFDHVIPLSRGGPTSVDNLRVLCMSCNRKKSDTLTNLLAGSPFVEAKATAAQHVQGGRRRKQRL